VFGEFSSFVDEHQHVMSQRCLPKKSCTFYHFPSGDQNICT